jgi:SAM-dependent methyltransferase
VTDSNRESSSYDEASPYYDIVYEAKKDYAREAERLRDVLTRYAERPVRELLDMACGTGLHDQHLAASYDVEGADLSSEHLAIARRRCPDLVFNKADMTGFDLGRDFGPVICLFLFHRSRLERAEPLLCDPRHGCSCPSRRTRRDRAVH